MRTSLQRNDKYAAKTNAATVGLKFAVRLPFMPDNFAASMNSIVPKQAGTAEILNADGIARPMRGAYQAFCCELWKASTVCQDAALTLEAASLVSKWTARGLLADTLGHITDQVFHLVPTP